MGNNLSSSNKFASQGLKKLISQGIHNKESEILEILNAFPELKESTLTNKKFQKQFFKDLKKKHFRSYEDDYDKHNANHNWIIEYAIKYDFIQNDIIADKEIQDMLAGKIRFEINSLKRVARQYGDNECTQYTRDRLGSLLTLEEIYTYRGIILKNTHEHNSGLLEVLTEWTKRRVGGVRYPRVLDLVNTSGASIEDISYAISKGRANRQYDPDVLQVKQFPAVELTKPSVRGEIEKVCKQCIGIADTVTLNRYITQYTFLHDVFVGYNAIIDKKMQNENVTLTESEQETLRAIKDGIIQSLITGSTTKAGEIIGFFPNAKNILTHGEIVNAIYKGLDYIEKHNLNNKSKKNTDAAALLKDFPLSDQDAADYMQKHVEYIIKNVRYFDQDSFIDNLKQTLSIFPDADFSTMLNLQHIRSYIGSYLPFITKENRDLIIQLAGFSESEIEDIHISRFMERLKEANNLDNHHRNSYKLKEARTILLHCDSSNKISLKTKLQTEELKKLLRTYMCDRYLSHTDEICTDPLFPVTLEELHQNIIDLFYIYCKEGKKDDISRLKTNYQVVNEKISHPDDTMIDASLKGIETIINKIATEYEINRNIRDLKELLQLLPFLNANRKSVAIQNAIQNKANYFLGEGNIRVANRIQERQNIDNIK